MGWKEERGTAVNKDVQRHADDVRQQVQDIFPEMTRLELEGLDVEASWSPDKSRYVVEKVSRKSDGKVLHRCEIPASSTKNPYIGNRIVLKETKS